MANEKTVSQNGSKDHVSTAFKWFHATSVNGGAMLIAAVLASYLSVYMTDTLMIPAATASLIMFISTLWDAINDPMMGMTQSARNFLLFSSIRLHCFVPL